MTHIWLAQDPETGRISAQAQEWDIEHDFPRGLRGKGWALRETDVPTQTWTKMCKATFSPDSQDRLHQEWWEQAEGVDE